MTADEEAPAPLDPIQQARADGILHVLDKLADALGDEGAISGRRLRSMAREIREAT